MYYPPIGARHAFNSATACLPEGFAAHLEVLELVEAGTGRATAEHNLAAVIRGRVRGGVLTAASSVPEIS
jgi:hypothetical protein